MYIQIYVLALVRMFCASTPPPLLLSFGHILSLLAREEEQKPSYRILTCHETSIIHRVLCITGGSPQCFVKNAFNLGRPFSFGSTDQHLGTNLYRDSCLGYAISRVLMCLVYFKFGFHKNHQDITTEGCEIHRKSMKKHIYLSHTEMHLDFNMLP